MADEQGKMDLDEVRALLRYLEDRNDFFADPMSRAGLGDGYFDAAAFQPIKEYLNNPDPWQSRLRGQAAAFNEGNLTLPNLIADEILNGGDSISVLVKLQALEKSQPELFAQIAPTTTDNVGAVVPDWKLIQSTAESAFENYMQEQQNLMQYKQDDGGYYSETPSKAAQRFTDLGLPLPTKTYDSPQALGGALAPDSLPSQMGASTYMDFDRLYNERVIDPVRAQSSAMRQQLAADREAMARSQIEAAAPQSPSDVERYLGYVPGARGAAAGAAVLGKVDPSDAWGLLRRLVSPFQAPAPSGSGIPEGVSPLLPAPLRPLANVKLDSSPKAPSGVLAGGATKALLDSKEKQASDVDALKRRLVEEHIANKARIFNDPDYLRRTGRLMGMAARGQTPLTDTLGGLGASVGMGTGFQPITEEVGGRRYLPTDRANPNYYRNMVDAWRRSRGMKEVDWDLDRSGR